MAANEILLLPRGPACDRPRSKYGSAKARHTKLASNGSHNNRPMKSGGCTNFLPAAALPRGPLRHFSSLAKSLTGLAGLRSQRPGKPGAPDVGVDKSDTFLHSRADRVWTGASLVTIKTRLRCYPSLQHGNLGRRVLTEDEPTMQ